MDISQFDISEYKCLNLTAEEIAAIQRYAGPFHTEINILLDLDPMLITDLSKGWNIDLSQDTIDKNLQYILKIYSAMYKYSRTHPAKLNLYRGTTRKEIERLLRDKNARRFLSATSNKETAMTFTEYGNGTLLDVIGDDIPYIDMTSFLDENQPREFEFLISPYCKVERLRAFGVEDKNVRRYLLNLSKPKFLSITEAEEENAKSIFRNFDFPSKIAEFKKLKDDYYIQRTWYDRQKKNVRGNKNKEDIDFLRNEMEKTLQNLNNLSEEFKKVRTALNTYLQGKFHEIEESIDISIEEEAKQDLRTRRVSEYEKNKKYLISCVENYKNQIEEARELYLSEDEYEDKLNKLASTLGIPSGKSKDVNSAFEDITKKFGTIIDEINQIEISDDLVDNEESRKNLDSRIIGMDDRLNAIGQFIKNRFPDSLKDLVLKLKSQEKENSLKRIFDLVSENLLRKAKSDLIAQRDKLAGKKDTIFDKLFGKARVKKAEIENFNLKINAINRDAIVIPNDLKTLRAYISKYSDNVGYENLPRDAQIVLENLGKTEKPDLANIDPFDIINPHLPIPTENGKKLSNRAILKILNFQNKQLMEVIKNPENKKPREKFKGIVCLPSFLSRLALIEFAVEQKGKEGKEGIKKESIE